MAGTRTQVISLWEFYQRLPAAALPVPAPRNRASQMTGRRCPPPTSPPSWRPAAATWPRREFAQVARLYYDIAEAADAWLDNVMALPATRATVSSLPGSRRR